MYFVHTSLSVKYNIRFKALKHRCFFCMKYTPLGESLMTNVALRQKTITKLL